AHEYFREPGLGDDDFAAQLLPDTELPGTDPDDAREACRALKGSLLRQETYALDGTDKSANPYSVSERSYSVVQLQPRGDGRYGVFFAHAAESLEYHYERNPADPRIGHSLTLAVDAFGNVLESAAIGYGRRAADADLSTVEAAAQTQTLIKWSRHDFTNAIDDAQTWRTPAPAESREYEVTALPLAPRATRYSAADFAGAAALPAIGYEETPTLLSPQKRLLADARTIYRRDDLTAPLALGRLESRALPAGQYQLAFTPALLTARYAGRVSDTMLSSEGGYVHLDGDANWWAPSGSVFYSAAAADSPAVELATAQAHFFLPRRFQDPFGASATVAYDRYDLLPLETVDAAGNRVTAGERAADDSLLQSGIDYRVLSPALLTDANRNRSAVAFDTRGLVVGTAVMGKPGETVGDSLAGFQTDLTDAEIAAHLNDPLASAADVLGRASTRVIYDLFA
ncbi:MAG TPA: toxin TcdB middle/C-terminal domain-containing protein, partial [Polyangia bacterium]|nr:toxin TcdB middle/C-terminal domain-containing protein [Polyangia bacterium]